LLKEKGPKEFTINVAGIGIFFLFDRNLSEFGVENINYDFITDNRAEIKLRVHYDSSPERKKGGKIFDTGRTWSIYSNQGKLFLQDSSFESGSLPNQLVILESDFKSGDIYINDELNKNFLPDPLGYPLNQILMIILLSRCKGVMLHACGIDDRGYGYLFLGNSGHGKSTIARLWSENQATVLNDDRIIVREKNGELFMYGTPWHGDFKEVSSKGLPIRKLFFLRHGEKNSAVPKNGTEAVLMLLTRCFPPIWDKKGMEYTMDLCHRLVNKVQCYEFSFEPDKKIVDFVRNI
jgi:hypothetical protein